MRAARLLAALLLLTTPAWAQEAPPLLSGVERPPERPQAAPPDSATDPSGGDERPDARPPHSPPAQRGRLTPPSAPAAGPQGSLAPPESQPEPPAGPPQRELLRESDFDFSACLLALHVMGATWETGPAITGKARDCGIARPVTLTEALPGLALEGAPPMRCETARALAWWLRDHVLPSAARLPGAPRPQALVLGTTYQCRSVVGGGKAPRLSEHAFGNAVDIAAIRFDSGESVAVPQAGGSDMPAAFLAAIRGAACLYFTTVLGPGSNAAHGDHLHLDIKERRGGYRICE